MTERKIPPANPYDPETRLVRAIFGYCPDHDECTPEDHPEMTLDIFGHSFNLTCKCGHKFSDHAIMGAYRDECQVCDCRLFGDKQSS